MNARDAIKLGIGSADLLTKMYLEDLTDADLLVRPVAGANHIAWQLGHLVAAEHGMLEATFPGSMPPLPEGFKERYTTETSRLDSAGAFHPKSVYLDLCAAQRAGTLKALDKVTDADLDKPGPEALRSFVKTIGEVFNMQGTHWLMHVGQWAIVRRKLGKAPLI